MEILGQVLHGLLFAFLVLLFVRFVVEWVQVFARSWTPAGPLLVVLEVVYTVTDPPVRALRSVIPPLRLGGVALDLSFLLVLIGTYVLLNVVEAVFL